jgi:hypothetical protein
VTATVPAPECEIVTFYSYKGGTGRSMMLASVAWILASNGKRVLAVDWDLEAPGLHRYFEPFMVDRYLTRSDGIVDLVTQFVAEALTPAEAGEAAEGGWSVSLADIRRYAFALDFRFRDGGALHFLPAGRQSASYATRVNSFDWTRFYEQFGGGTFLEAVRAVMREHYDYVLIDSRTGVSDTSGICTVQMPDTLVACFTLNNQGIDGASAVARSVLAQRQSPPVRILPVPMRVDNSEKDKLEARLSYAREQFAGLPSDRTAGELDAYWADVEVPYVPWYSYEEALATFADRPSRAHTTLAAAEQLTRHLTRGKVSELVPPTESERQGVLAAYGRRAEGEAARITERFDVYLSYDISTAPIVERLADRLRSQGLRVWFDRWMLTAGTNVAKEIGAALNASRTCAFLVGESGFGPGQANDLDRAAHRAESDATFRFFAVLLPGAPDMISLPPALEARMAVDMREGTSNGEGLRRFVQAVSGVAPGQQKVTDSVQLGKTLRFRLTALQARLNFVDASAEWLASTATTTPIATAEVANELQELSSMMRRQVWDFQARVLSDEAGLPSASWYSDVDHRVSELFDNCLQLLGGVSIRQQGLDSGMCRVADVLLDEITAATYSRPKVALPAVFGASTTTRHVVKIHFPDWTIWTLPLVAHEHAHTVVQEQEDLRAVLESLTAEFGEGRARQGSQMTEFLADAFATWVMGPAYACAALLLMFKPDRDLSAAERATVILGTLDRLSARDSTGLVSPSTPLIHLLASLWQELLRQTSMEDRAEADRAELDSIVYAAVKHLERVLPFAAYGERQTLSTAWLAEKLNVALEQRQPDIDASDLTVRDLLNAAWVARLGNDERYAETLNDAVKNLALQVADERRRPGWSRGP